MRSLDLSALIVTVFLATSCRLGESLDDFTGGPGGGTGATGGAGGSTGGAGGTGGMGGTGAGSPAGAGGVAGTGGSGGASMPCETTPTSCDDIGSDEPSQAAGCCDGNIRYWCGVVGSQWQVRSENCEASGKTCSLDDISMKMACVGGTAGSGGASACESGACEGPCADCDGNPLDCETDTNTDSEHCGSCSHSCQGGACVGGTCQVTILASNQYTPWGIAVDETAAYWVSEGEASDDGKVYSVPQAGGSPAELANGQKGPVQIRASADYLYWTNFQGGGSVRRMTKDGTDLITLAQASGGWSLTLGGLDVYWTNTSDGSIRQVAQSGGQPVVLLSGEQTPRGIAADSSHLYWTASNGGEIRRANTDGTGKETLVPGQSYPLGVAVDDTWVYWTELGDSYALGDCSAATGRVVRARKNDGSDRQTIADGQACPMNVLVTDGLVFWTNAGTVTNSVYNYDGTVQQVATNGTSLKVIASGQERPYGIAVGATAVYWSNQGVFPGQGSIMKIAR